jgi:fructokinase
MVGEVVTRRDLLVRLARPRQIRTARTVLLSRRRAARSPRRASPSEKLVRGWSGSNETLVMIDPNCRPDAISDHDAYRARLKRILSRADVVKASTEDLAYLCPDSPARAAAASLLGQGPALVLVTDGPRAALAFMPGQEITVEVPDVPVVDTIGAGDAFGGAFLAWWAGNNLGRPDLHRTSAISDAMRLAAATAALTCTRAGAEPPWLSELPTPPGWAFG